MSQANVELVRRLQPAPDAVQIDTTNLEVEDVVAQIVEMVRAVRQPA